MALTSTSQLAPGTMPCTVGVHALPAVTFFLECFVIGERLREMRSTRNLSLRELSAATGLSATLLSQVERGVTEPSLVTLRKLATYFGESVAAMFTDPAAPSVSISRPGHRLMLTAPGSHFAYERLARGDGKLEVLRGVLLSGESTSAEPWPHPSAECVYVIAGELIAEVAGTDYPVRAGESISFDARQAHRYRNAGEAESEFILSVTPPVP